MKNFWLKFKNWIITFVIGSAVLASGLAVLPEQTPKHLKLKCSKEMVIGYKAKGNIIKYAYNSGIKIKNKNNEILERRTKYSTTIKIGKNKFQTEIISGVPQYYKDENNNWYQAEYATTTEEQFKKQTKISFIKKLFGKTAEATTSTFYPDANSVDGDAVHVYSLGSGASWSTIIGQVGTGANYTDANGKVFYVYADSVSNQWRYLLRGIFTFDTSAIGTDTINSATLSLRGTSKNDVLNITPNINIYSSAPANDTTIVAGDYDSLGSTAFSTAITFANYNVAGYNDFILNASGLAAIDGTGISKFGVRNPSYDVAAQDPFWSNNVQSIMYAYCSEQIGTDNDPKLVVVHEAAAEDTCTYSSGDWVVLESDNCYITSDVYVDGEFNLIGSSTGQFGCASGIKVSAENFNFGTDNTTFDTKCFVHH